MVLKIIDNRILKTYYFPGSKRMYTETEREVLQWYVDMNAGGTPHTTEEIDRVKKLINDLE